MFWNRITCMSYCIQPITYEGTYEGSAIGIVSYVDWGYVVDNVVNIPVGSTVEFGYED